MRTKALLLTAALGAAGVATSMAQVYSVNAVGYVNVTLAKAAGKPSTFAIVANPLNGTNNLITTVLPTPPDLTKVYVFRDTGGGVYDYKIETYLGGGVWFPGDTVLAPGEGFFLELDGTAPDPTTITFVGEVPQGNLTNDIPANYTIKSSLVPQSGGVTSVLGLNANTSDILYAFDRTTQDYVLYTSLGGGVWFPSEPVVGVAEGFFYFNSTGASFPWGRTFTVN